ncbi:unnamed protein product [Mytilus edulis]|uniref:Uncharacterized protein n=1 Tax=Mytilus edulis TaxID=6550 RepID=A0A8S3RDA2_MYTED|nr:unnamed protein product [Mytilus edulis]
MHGRRHVTGSIFHDRVLTYKTVCCYSKGQVITVETRLLPCKTGNRCYSTCHAVMVRDIWLEKRTGYRYYSTVEYFVVQNKVLQCRVVCYSTGDEMLQNKTHCTCGYRRKQSVKVQYMILQYMTVFKRLKNSTVYNSAGQYVTVHDILLQYMIYCFSTCQICTRLVVNVQKWSVLQGFTVQEYRTRFYSTVVMDKVLQYRSIGQGFTVQKTRCFSKGQVVTVNGRLFSTEQVTSITFQDRLLQWRAGCYNTGLILTVQDKWLSYWKGCYNTGQDAYIVQDCAKDGVTYIVHDRLLHFITYSIGHVVTADFRLCQYRTCSDRLLEYAVQDMVFRKRTGCNISDQGLHNWTDCNSLGQVVTVGTKDSSYSIRQCFTGQDRLLQYILGYNNKRQFLKTFQDNLIQYRSGCYHRGQGVTSYGTGKVVTVQDRLLHFRTICYSIGKVVTVERKDRILPYMQGVKVQGHVKTVKVVTEKDMLLQYRNRNSIGYVTIQKRVLLYRT